MTMPPDIELVIDEDDQTEPPIQYNITSFGADYDVDGLVRRLRRKDIIVPDFQREYVWKVTDASRFVESLLFGLPVPSIFLAREPDTNRFLVIDGQQRLLTLQFFYDGFFDPKKDEKSKKVFRLTKVQKQYEGKTYAELPDPDRIRLDNALLHAIIIRQDTPGDDDTSIYHIFERLNTGGKKLSPQEIRNAAFHGELMSRVIELNNYEPWRAIFGKLNERLKDEELVLRFLALYYFSDSYEKPMNEFLNRFSRKNRNPSPEKLSEMSALFENTLGTIFDCIGDSAFRPEGTLNAAVFDAVSVATARVFGFEKPDKKRWISAYQTLLADSDFKAAVSKATSDENNLDTRLKLATAAFEKAK